MIPILSRVGRANLELLPHFIFLGKSGPYRDLISRYWTLLDASIHGNFLFMRSANSVTVLVLWNEINSESARTARLLMLAFQSYSCLLCATCVGLQMDKPTAISCLTEHLLYIGSSVSRSRTRLYKNWPLAAFGYVSNLLSESYTLNFCLCKAFPSMFLVIVDPFPSQLSIQVS